MPFSSIHVFRAHWRSTVSIRYLNQGISRVELMVRGMVWLKSGSYDSLNDVGIYILNLEHRQRLKGRGGQRKLVASLQGLITAGQLNQHNL